MFIFFIFFAFYNADLRKSIGTKHIKNILNGHKIENYDLLPNIQKEVSKNDYSASLLEDKKLNEGENAKELNEKRIEKENLIDNSKKFNERENNDESHQKEMGRHIQNSKERKNANKKMNQDSLKELENNINHIKAGIELLKVKNNFKRKANDQGNNIEKDSKKKTFQKNKMAEILDQIRERYAPPTTPASRITFGSILFTFFVLIMIAGFTYLMISRFFKIKSSEVNDEELPFMLGQQINQEHDLSVHGFSKI